MNNTLSHFNEDGLAHMVGVGDKSHTKRTAIAEGWIKMSIHAFQALDQGNNKKGDVIGIARIAAIMATKKTSDMIPLCHPIGLTHVHVDFIKDPEQHRVKIEVTAETTGQTGVEMEALMGTTTGLLTIYDMLKAIDKSMEITQIRLVEKKGGKSGHYKANLD